MLVSAWRAWAPNSCWAFQPMFSAETPSGRRRRRAGEATRLLAVLRVEKLVPRASPGGSHRGFCAKIGASNEPTFSDKATKAKPSAARLAPRGGEKTQSKHRGQDNTAPPSLAGEARFVPATRPDSGSSIGPQLVASVKPGTHKMVRPAERKQKLVIQIMTLDVSAFTYGTRLHQHIGGVRSHTGTSFDENHMRFVMRISTKFILATLTAVVLTSPVMAETSRHARAHARAMASASDARGSAAPTLRGQSAPATATLIQDCVHVAFPQCGGN